MMELNAEVRMQNAECRMISVALCTFNGEEFLPEQLRSLQNQSRLPDELVVCDDGSKDRTVEMLKSFSRSAPFPVKIYQNENQMGPAGNFAQAIALCEGRIISFCDQDDIWESEKLQKTLQVFDRNPQTAFVFSDAEVCDDDCEPLGYRLWTSVGFLGPLREQFDSGNGADVLLRQNVVTGATLSFAARFRPLILPIPGGWFHDGWIALLLSAVGRGQAIAEPLIRYRQHANQSVGATRRSLYQQYLNAKVMDRNVFAEQANQYEAALARLQEQTDFDVPMEVIRRLQEKIQHCRIRSKIRLGQSARVLPALGELLSSRYSRYSLGWKSFAQDLFL
jgi:glycosyltransferase involved in cell wall biosynthesis